MKKLHIILEKKIKKCSITELEKILRILFPNMNVSFKDWNLLQVKLKEKDNFHFDLRFVNDIIPGKDPILIVKMWTDNPFSIKDIPLVELIKLANPTEKQLEMITLLIS